MAFVRYVLLSCFNLFLFPVFFLQWEIAAACLTLFEGLIQAFLRRMQAVAILAAGSANCSEEQLALFDWSTLLTGGQLKTTKLKIPRGWPFTDPGYQFVTQLLTNSSLFSLVTLFWS